MAVQWQTAEDFGERRRIRARMYRLRELRLREMVQNDEESLGTLTATEGEEELSLEVAIDSELQASSRRSSTVEVTSCVMSDILVASSLKFGIFRTLGCC